MKETDYKTKFKTKYMEVEHLKKANRTQRTKLLNIISDLKSEAIKYVKDEDLSYFVETVNAITKGLN